MKKVLSYLVFWLVQWTWGILMNIVGLGCLIVFACAGGTVRAFGPYVYCETSLLYNCGFNCGMFFFMGKSCYSVGPHECGHGVQNMIFGPLTPFVVCIPSVVRFWYRRWLRDKDINAYLALSPYDSVWFEAQATAWGKVMCGDAWQEHLRKIR